MRPHPGGVYVDCTVGCGGHSRAILEAAKPGGRLVGIDCDRDAISAAAEVLKDFSDRCRLVCENFEGLREILNSSGLKVADGILFDLGVSALQLEEPERGFSIRRDGPLDMRMDRRAPGTAFDIVNNLPEKEIEAALRMYGEERYSRRIARAIVSRRRQNEIKTTGELARVVLSSVSSSGKGRIHPATRTFQALRIKLNRELDILQKVIEGACLSLAPGGRVCIISYHSLEDRIVKQEFLRLSRAGIVRPVTKKPIIPERAEVKINPRSRSGKLRVAERTEVVL